MGLGSPSPIEGNGGGGCKATASSTSCSICLEDVVDGGDRSWAKLQCGHRFHLDCIGSAFNSKGAMQCPNCRKTEKGQWLYANGCRPVSEFTMEDWANDDDLNDLSSYAELSFWCPFSGLASLPSILDEADFSPAPSHPCPYLAYVSPSSGISDGSSFGNQWSGPGESSPNSYPFPSMEPHYRVWDPLFPTNLQASGVDQSPILPAARRAAMNSSEIVRPGGMHPFGVGHSSAVRGPNTVVTSLHPPFPVAQPPRDRFPQTPRATTAAANPVAPPSGGRRSSSSSHHRLMMSSSSTAAASSSSDQSSSALYVFSSGRVHQEVDRSRIYGWQQQQHQHPPSPESNLPAVWILPPQFQPSSADNRPRPSQHHHHRHHQS